MPLLFSMLSRLVIPFLPRKNMSSKTFLVCCCCCLVSLIWPFCNPMDCSPPGSTRFPWDFPGKNTGVGCPFLLLGIFPTQRLNLCLLFVRQVFYHWATWEAPLLVYPHCFLLRPVQPRNSPGGTQFPLIKIEQEPCSNIGRDGLCLAGASVFIPKFQTLSWGWVGGTWEVPGERSPCSNQQEAGPPGCDLWSWYPLCTMGSCREASEHRWCRGSFPSPPLSHAVKPCISTGLT